MVSVKLVLLDAKQDGAAVLEVFERCTDYVVLETGEPPETDNVTEFFTDVPKGLPLSNAMKLGVCLDGRLVGLVDVVRGHPQAKDWYIGLLMLDPAVRNLGLGARVVNKIIKAARSEYIERLLLCVLEENLRARAFWRREGFTLNQEAPPRATGRKTHRRYELVRVVSEE